jgi:hypothetical protein
MMIRQATLDDSAGISKLFRSGIATWQRMDAQGRVLDLPYEELRIYERWLHGGAWMSLETGSIWLNHLLGGAGLAYVLEDSLIHAYAEAYFSKESDPYGYHLHIGEFIGIDDDSRDAMMQHLLTQAKSIGRITASCNAYDSERISFFKRYGLNELSQIQHVTLSAQGGHVGFYKVTEHLNTDAAQISDWGMPLGRTTSARMHWEALWPLLWRSLPEMESRKRHRLRFNVAGQDAFVCIQQAQYDPRAAEIFCWTPKSLSGQLIGAIRDWAYKSSYRSLSIAVSQSVAKLFGTDLEASPYQQVILARDV